MGKASTLEILRKYLSVNPDIMLDIKNIMDYRRLRTEQGLYSLYAKEYKYDQANSKYKEVREAGELDVDFWKNRIMDLDKKRRGVHNKSLLSYINILEIGDKNNFPLFYEGERLTKDDVKFYNTGKYEERRLMTDSMFELLYNMENDIIKEMSYKQKNENNMSGLNKYIYNIEEDFKKQNRDYKVKKPITRDEDRPEDGEIEFYAENIVSIDKCEELKKTGINNNNDDGNITGVYQF